MKKALFIAAILFAFTTQAQIVKYPFGAADFSALTVDNDTLTITATNSLVYKTLSDTLVGNTLFYATIGGGVKAGDRLFVRSLNGATARTITFSSTYFTCPAITTTASKTKVYAFIYDGSKYIYQGATQID